MINDKLINVFLQNAEQKDLIRGIKEILNHFKIDSEYRYEELVNNIVNIIGGDKLPTIEDIDINLVKDNVDNFTYKREGNDYKNNDRIKYTDYLKKVKEN